MAASVSDITQQTSAMCDLIPRYVTEVSRRYLAITGTPREIARPYESLRDKGDHARIYQTQGDHTREPNRAYEIIQELTRAYDTIHEPAREYESLREPTIVCESLREFARVYKSLRDSERSKYETIRQFTRQ